MPLVLVLVLVFNCGVAWFVGPGAEAPNPF
jgi:hypothetical protein